MGLVLQVLGGAAVCVADPSLIQLVQAERWNGVLPTTMIPDSTVPFLNTRD